MPWAHTLLDGFTIGLASSAHCAGMCGVFAVRAGTGGSPTGRMALYLGGKTFTYVFLGAVAGLAGAAVLDTVQGAAPWLAFAVAGVLLVTGARLLLPAHAIGAGGSFLGRLLAPAFRAAHGAESAGGPFALGAVTGLLPCGVVYVAALRGAATGTPLGGAAAMAAFGLGTMPILAAIGLFGARALRMFGPARLRVAGGVILILAGGVGVFRAFVDPTACCH